jgi:hypothetical protein
MTFLSTPATQGFGPIEVSDFLLNGAHLSVDFTDAISSGVVNRSVSTASTVTLTVEDAQRQILQSGIFTFGNELTIEGLQFSLVAVTKAGDSLQIIFESSGVAALRLQTGAQATTTSTDITSFIASLVAAVPGLKFVGQVGTVNDGSGNPVSIGRGTTADPTEDSWTCIQRVATSAGWRCFETNGTIFLGSDTYFLGVGSQGTLSEFTIPIQNMDFTYDIGQPFGTVNVTGMSSFWEYPPGAVVYTSGLGPVDGQPWLVQSCQRDLFNPQMSAVLYAPMPPFDVINPPTFASFT